jgi:hypothetical protein
MDEHFASLQLDNATALCVGGITRAEADAAQGDGAEIDGRGYYLFLSDESGPRQPIQVLAKFLSAFEAEQLSRLFARRS